MASVAGRKPGILYKRHSMADRKYKSKLLLLAPTRPTMLKFKAVRLSERCDA